MSVTFKSLESASVRWKLAWQAICPTFQKIWQWPERRRQRSALLALDDDHLRDIGISSAQARREGQKPFWKD